MSYFIHGCVKYSRIWVFRDPFINLFVKLSISELKINKNHKARKCVVLQPENCKLQPDLPLISLLTIYKYHLSGVNLIVWMRFINKLPKHCF